MHGSKWGKLYSIQSWKAVGPAIGTIVIYLPACHKGESPAVADPEGKQENRKSLFISSNSGSSQVVKWRIDRRLAISLPPEYWDCCLPISLTARLWLLRGLSQQEPRCAALPRSGETKADLTWRPPRASLPAVVQHACLLRPLGLARLTIVGNLCRWTGCYEEIWHKKRKQLMRTLVLCSIETKLKACFSVHNTYSSISMVYGTYFRFH